jgi:hypothetical protein
MSFRQELRELVKKHLNPTCTPRDYLDIAEDLEHEALWVDGEAHRTLEGEINGWFRTDRRRA